MKKYTAPFFVYLLLLIASCTNNKKQETPKQDSTTIDYGNNSTAGNFADVNGIKMYYEVYGSGKPLILIHGNGGSIKDMKGQIEYFSKSYKVIVADSRSHGKTTDSEGLINYPQMAEDWNALMGQLKIDSAYIIGWSDGGILSLLLAINHPDKVKMFAAMGANLEPDSSAIHPWAVQWVKEMAAHTDAMLAKNDTTENWRLHQKLLNLLGQQPHIPVSYLHKISAPALILCGDRDVVKEEHTMEIYHNIAKSWLCIFPGETHMIPATNPALFNATVDSFFSKPYTRPDTKTFFGIQ